MQQTNHLYESIHTSGVYQHLIKENMNYLSIYNGIASKVRITEASASKQIDC